MTHTLEITVFRSRRDTQGEVQAWNWPALATRLSHSTQTSETSAEYGEMSKDEQGTIKDIGGLVGGALTGGQRKAAALESRSMLTLDMDEGTAAEVWAGIQTLTKAAAVYSTHGPLPDAPRLRPIMPLTRPVSALEYEAIARALASKIGIDFSDVARVRSSQLMYWRSHPQDVPPAFWITPTPPGCGDPRQVS